MAHRIALVLKVRRCLAIHTHHRECSRVRSTGIPVDEGHFVISSAVFDFGIARCEGHQQF